MQMYARAYAKLYNSYDCPKKIDLVKAWVLELIDRPNHPMYVLQCEHMILFLSHVLYQVCRGTFHCRALSQAQQ